MWGVVESLDLSECAIVNCGLSKFQRLVSARFSECRGTINLTGAPNTLTDVILLRCQEVITNILHPLLRNAKRLRLLELC
jgi:hypothetical protein